jgi:hypothetical protein
MRDGAGYCSPGRWHPLDRSRPDFASSFIDLIDAQVPVENDFKLIVLKVLLGKMEESPVKIAGLALRHSFEKRLCELGFRRVLPKSYLHEMG